MISDILQALERGMLVMRSNSRMLLVGVLVFIFPLLFVWITQSFFETSYNNIQTADDNRIASIHESMSILLSNDPEEFVVINSTIKNLSLVNEDLKVFRILTENEDGFLIRYAENESLVGAYNPPNRLLTDVGFTESRDFIRTEFTVDNHRVWQVFTKVNVVEQDFYIFTEHNFSQVDNIMSARRQQSYFGLTAIFVFLIALAYWLNRQVHWEKNSNKLSRQLEERDLFSNMIAHEFRSPLTAIKGYASFLQESENLSKEEIRFANNIHISAERLVTLVSDFLEVARIQSGSLKIQSEEIDMREVLTRIVEDLKVMAEEKDLQLVYTETSEPLLLVSDSARITQVLTNIISNAIKYTESGKVELECTSMPGELTVRVKDSGMGISAEDQQKLFAPFSRVGGVDNTSIKGTGLGMWITKQLVELLKGTIGVESIKGVGTHVVIKFKT